MASDSRALSEAIGICAPATKIYRIKAGKKEFLLGCAGHNSSCMWFIEWFKSKDESLRSRIMASCAAEGRGFHVLIWDGKKLSDADEMCIIESVDDKYYAIGSGAAHAITAMDCGKSARQAIQMAIKRDHNSGGRIVTATLQPQVKA